MSETDKKIPVRFSLKERDLILDNTFFISPDLTNRLKMSIVKSESITVHYSLTELEEFIGFIAAESNYTEDEKLQNAFDRIYYRLSDLLESHIEIGAEE